MRNTSSYLSLSSPVISTVIMDLVMWLDLTNGSSANMTTSLFLHIVVSLLNHGMPKIACFIGEVEENQGIVTNRTSQLLAVRLWLLGSTSFQITW